MPQSPSIRFSKRPDGFSSKKVVRTPDMERIRSLCTCCVDHCPDSSNSIQALIRQNMASRTKTTSVDVVAGITSSRLNSSWVTEQPATPKQPSISPTNHRK